MTFTCIMPVQLSYIKKKKIIIVLKFRRNAKEKYVNQRFLNSLVILLLRVKYRLLCTSFIIDSSGL